MKNKKFVLSGYILNDNETGLEGSVAFDGYQGSPLYNTKEDGYFIFEMDKVSILEILYKHFLLISVKTGPNSFQGSMLYKFRIRRGKHIKLKIYPYSNRVDEIEA